MILIADSGSTKTHWCSVDNSGVCEFVTQGLNPRLTNEDTLLTVFRQTREHLGDPDEVFFYGAGCGTIEIQQRMATLLSVVFLQAKCHCEGDLLGACRATCGSRPGMVGILGTGSNLCYYDGDKIALQRVSTGYILGDEGSGNHIGKRLLKDYLEERMPSHLRIMFHDSYGMTHGQFLDRLYSHPYPNRFLASFVPFAAQHHDDPYITTVLHDCFGSFFNQLDYFEAHRRMPLNLVGGIVRTFLPAIQQAAESQGVKLGLILPDPMQGLLRYHKR